MPDDNLILEHLRAIRAKLDDHDKQFADIKSRLHSVEDQVAGLRADLNQYVHRQDALDDRMRRTEQRLELRDS